MEQYAAAKTAARKRATPSLRAWSARGTKGLVCGHILPLGFQASSVRMSMAETDLRQSYNPSMNSGKTVAGRVDGTGEIEGSTLQEVLADLKYSLLFCRWMNFIPQHW